MLTKKMLLVYFIFAGLFCIVAILAFHISMEIFEKRLYETSVQELDYYVQSVRESLEEVEDKSYEMSMDEEIQNLFSELKQANPVTSEYNRMLTDLRWRLANENNSQSAMIRLLTSVIPLIAYVMVVLIMRFYDLDKIIPEIKGREATE